MASYALMSGPDQIMTLDVSHPDLLPGKESSQVWVEVPYPASKYCVQLENNEYTVIPRQPSLMDVKENKRQEAETYFSMRLSGACNTIIGYVQCSTESQADINIKAQQAVVAKMSSNNAWSISWRLADNSFSQSMTADQMLEMSQQVSTYVDGCTKALWDIKDLINQASFNSDVLAIDVTQGYPTPS